MAIEVYFQWRQRGGSWTTTTAQTVEESAEFEEDLTGLDTENEGYEFRAVVDDDGTVTEGSISSFGAAPDIVPRSSLKLSLGVSL